MHDDTPVRRAVEMFFAEDGWPYGETAVADVLQTRYGGRTMPWVCLAEIREPASQLIFYSLVAERPDPEHLGAVAEFLTRANFGLPVGNFELDMTDGEIRFKTSLDVEGTEPTAQLVRQLVHSNVVVTDLHLPALFKVMSGDASPLEAANSITR